MTMVTEINIEDRGAVRSVTTDSGPRPYFADEIVAAVGPPIGRRLVFPTSARTMKLRHQVGTRGHRPFGWRYRDEVMEFHESESFTKPSWFITRPHL